MKIVVSHPGKQHAYRLINSLVELGHEVVFCTAFAITKENPLHKLLPRTLHKRLLTSSSVKIKSWPYLEIFRKISIMAFPSKRAEVQFYFEKQFDRLAARWLEKHDYDLFVGYEMSSLNSFKAVARAGKISILDLAQIHFEEIEAYSQQYNALSNLAVSGNRLRKDINAVKKEELEIASHIFAISNFVKNSLIKHGINENKTSLVRIGTDRQNLVTADKYRNFTVLYVGTIRKQKGTDLLIDAVKQLREDTKADIKLQLVGNVTDIELKPMIDECDFIEHLGFLSHEALKKHYLSSHVFCIPSLLDSWGMVVLEAMSCGLPVVVSQNTGAKEVVEHGGGIIIESDNASAIKHALKKLFDNRELLKSLENEAKSISTQYSFDLYKNEISAGIRKALDG